MAVEEEEGENSVKVTEKKAKMALSMEDGDDTAASLRGGDMQSRFRHSASPFFDRGIPDSRVPKRVTHLIQLLIRAAPGGGVDAETRSAALLSERTTQAVADHQPVLLVPRREGRPAGCLAGTQAIHPSGRPGEGLQYTQFGV